MKSLIPLGTGEVNLYISKIDPWMDHKFTIKNLYVNTKMHAICLKCGCNVILSTPIGLLDEKNLDSYCVHV